MHVFACLCYFGDQRSTNWWPLLLVSCSIHINVHDVHISPVRAFKTNTTRAQTPMLRLDISGPGMVMSLSETHGNWKQMLVLKPLNSPKKIWVWGKWGNEVTLNFNGQSWTTKAMYMGLYNHHQRLATPILFGGKSYHWAPLDFHCVLRKIWIFSKSWGYPLHPGGDIWGF